MADIEMPQLGETVTEGTITQWFKQVGEEVAEDEVLFEVSTDKVDSEVPSPVAGFVTEILVPEGETVDVGTRLAVVSSEPASGAASGGAGDEEQPAAPEPSAEALSAADEGSAQEPAADEKTADEEPAGEDPAEATAESASEEPAEPPAGSEAEPSAEAPADAEPAATDESTTPASGEKKAAAVLLSPLVRRLVNESDVDPSEIEGTGAGGRITRSDVERHLQQSDGRQRERAEPAAKTVTEPAKAAKASKVAAPAPDRAASAPTKAGQDDSVEPFNNIRRRTAEHMVRSKATSPHAYLTMEVDYEGVERVRRVHKEQFRADEGVSLTYLPFIARALIDAIEDFPHVNASVGDNELILHNDVHLGIAVDLNYEGLIVPVAHHASDKRLRALARDIAELADRSRTKKLSADDISGGTVTITNVGSSGNLILLPIINQPQVMILSTDGVARRPVVVNDGSGGESIAIHSVGNLTLGWDHRAFDGAYAAAFLGRLRDILQTRDWDAEM